MNFKKLVPAVLALALTGCWATTSRYINGQDVAVRSGEGWTRGTITNDDGDVYTLKRADGGTSKVRIGELRPLLGKDQAHVGQEVYAERSPSRAWQPGVITGMGPNAAKVKWDDGGGEQLVAYRRLAPR